MPDKNDSHYNQKQKAEEMVFQIDAALTMIPELNGNRRNLHCFNPCCDIVSKTAVVTPDIESFLNVRI